MPFMKTLFNNILSLHFLILGGLLQIVPLALKAQFQGKVYEEDFSVKVYAYGQEKTLAWAGGMNNPQFSVPDLNNDGLNDMVIYERINRSVKTFINKGTPGNPKYEYAPRYALNFPPVQSYLVMADYNCDGIADLFHLGDNIVAPMTGIAVFRGYYNADNELCFEYYKNLFYTNVSYMQYPVNAYVNPSDIPAIIDVDGDGDLDFVAYSNLSQVLYYQNTRVEDGLPCDSINIRLADNCWGKAWHPDDRYRRYNLGFSCDNSHLTRRTKDASGNKPTHTGGALCLFDADGDGDLDCLAGNESFDDMVFLRNGRKAPGYTGATDSMVFQDTLWKGLKLPRGPAAFWIDADADGRKDLLLAPSFENISENYRCAWFYKNTGTVQSPQYTLQTDIFLVDQMIDHGSSAYPLLYDYDKDGVMDLLIGSAGYYSPGGVFRSKLAYYKNTTTATEISFTLMNNDLLKMVDCGLAEAPPGTSKKISDYDCSSRGAAPAVGDLNLDGLDDMVLGHTDGTLSFYKNIADSAGVPPEWKYTHKLRDVSGNLIDVGEYAMPCIYDLNKDGKPDLIIGYMTGKLYYYENVGAPGELKLKYRTDTLGGVQVNDFYGKSAPFIGRMDNAGKDYLVIGSDRGNIYRYDGFEHGVDTGVFRLIDESYSSIVAGLHTAVTIGDLDHDGKYEMIIGNEFGGVTLYKQALLVDTTLDPPPIVVPPVVPAGESLKLYPNPAAGKLFIGVSKGDIPEDAEIIITNTVGQRIRTVAGIRGKADIELDIAHLSPGVYFCHIRYGGVIRAGTFVKQ